MKATDLITAPELAGLFTPDEEMEMASYRIEQRHPGCRLQISDHGCGRRSIQVFDDRQLIADYNV